MRILICGGTGFVGRQVAQTLALAGHEPVIRSRHSSPALDFSRALSADAWLPQLQGVDAVINTVGALRDTPTQSLDMLHTAAPVALFDACAQAGIRRVVQVSALGVDHGDTRYASTKRAADEHLLALNAAGRLDGVIARPSIIFGAGGASTNLFLALARSPILLLPQAVRSSRIQPIAVRDLADVLVHLVARDTPCGIVELGGPDPLTMDELIASLRAQMGLHPARVCDLPQWVSVAGAKFGDCFSALPWCSETLALLEKDNVTDARALSDLLEHPPVPPQQLYATLSDKARAA